MPRRRGRGQGAQLPNKYRARKTTVDGIVFDSQLEATCWLFLKARAQAGEIYNLDRQVSFDLEVNGRLVCRYVADFVYHETATGKRVVADAKGFLTEVYRLKKKLMLAVHDIDILELPEKPPKSRRKGPEVRKRRRKNG